VPAKAWSKVIADDMVMLLGERIMLRAQTRGKVFRKGGELVEFFVDGTSIGRTLSGGDGVAFKPYTPQKAGLHQIQVKSGVDEDRGLLFSLKKGTGVVFVDVEGPLLEDWFSRKPKMGSQDAVKEISKSFPVVFLQRGFVGVKLIKTWLMDHGFTALPVVPWADGKVFELLVEKGLRIEAVIGSETVIQSATKYEPRSFSFKPADKAVWVKEWKEIEEELRSEE
jgi:hypothetical protein